MVDAKQAVMIAKEHAGIMLGLDNPSLEEIEREPYKDRDVWMVTLGFMRESNAQSAVVRAFAPNTMDYKRFIIDAHSGELVAIKLREPATR